MAIDISNFAKAADASSLRPLDRDFAQAGIVAPNSSPGLWSAAAAIVPAVCYYGRVVPSRNMTIVKVAFVVNAADASNPAVDVGIADQAGNRLGAMGAATGRVNAIGRVVLTLPTPVALTAGVPYYAAFGCATSGTAATLLLVNDPASSLFGGAMPQLSSGYASAATVQVASGVLTSTQSCPLIMLLES